MPINDNIKGALLMSLAMAGFSLSDAIVKIVSADLNTGQIMFLRGALTSSIIVVVALRFGAFQHWRGLWDRWLAFRTVCEILAAIFYIQALSSLPLPNAAAILQSLPLMVTMGAALVLGETVGWRRWFAIAVGFCGVMVIIRPGAEGFTLASLLVVISVIAAAARDIATKKIDRQTPALLVSTVSAVSVSLAGALLIIPFGGWQPVTAHHLGLLVVGALALFTGYQAIVMSMRTGEISFIAPFRYTSLLWAIVLAALLLDEWPDRFMLLGAAIVVLAGVYAFHREHVRRRRIATAIDTQAGVSSP
jgi:drug/metabolite transporter (DMT)-like permease